MNSVSGIGDCSDGTVAPDFGRNAGTAVAVGTPNVSEAVAAPERLNKCDGPCCQEPLLLCLMGIRVYAALTFVRKSSMEERNTVACSFSS
jgi:hypothetical protein